MCYGDPWSGYRNGSRRAKERGCVLGYGAGVGNGYVDRTHRYRPMHAPIPRPSPHSSSASS